MSRILIVDDQEYVRTAIVVVLQASGHEAVGVHDAASALSRFDADSFDLAIVDVYMPDMDGVKLIKALRQRSPRLPVIAISGVFLNGSNQTALDFLARLPGMSGIVCLEKPFRPASLLKAIEKVLAVPA